MQIAKLLASKGHDVATIRADAPVREAVAALAEHGIGALVVSSDGRHIDGIVSERDVVRALNDDGGSVLDQPVGAIMSSTVYTTSPEDDTDTIMATMTNRRIRHVPVVQKDEDGALIGIVSIGDVVKARIGELELERKNLVDYIGAR